MSGYIAKSQIPIKPQVALPDVVRRALIDAKNRIRNQQGLVVFQNNFGAGRGDGSPLPKVSQGCIYYEFDAGTAHPASAAPGQPPNRGSFRMIFEVNETSRQVLEIYYTDEHYQKGTCFRIV